MWTCSTRRLSPWHWQARRPTHSSPSLARWPRGPWESRDSKEREFPPDLYPPSVRGRAPAGSPERFPDRREKQEPECKLPRAGLSSSLRFRCHCRRGTFPPAPEVLRRPWRTCRPQRPAGSALRGRGMRGRPGLPREPLPAGGMGWPHQAAGRAPRRSGGSQTGSRSARRIGWCRRPPGEAPRPWHLASFGADSPGARTGRVDRQAGQPAPGADPANFGDPGKGLAV